MRLPHCRKIRDLDPKTRRIWSCGNLCLFTGLALAQVGEGLGHRYSILFFGLRGFLLGLAIVFLAWSARRARRNGPCA